MELSSSVDTALFHTVWYLHSAAFVFSNHMKAVKIFGSRLLTKVGNSNFLNLDFSENIFIEASEDNFMQGFSWRIMGTYVFIYLFRSRCGIL